MTRDEAITSYIQGGSVLPEARWADREQIGYLIDGLAALGLLKLDGMLPQSHLDAPMPPVKPPRLPNRPSIISIETNDPKLARRIETMATIATFIGLFGSRWFVGSSKSSGIGTNYVYEAELVQVVENEQAAKAARCEPPPEHREKRYHWLRNGHGQLVIRAWDAEQSRFREHHEHSHPVLMDAEKLYSECGWRYVAPCEEPSPESR